MLRSLARPLLAGGFVARGLRLWERPVTALGPADRFCTEVAEPLGLPRDPELYVRASGAVMTGAAALLALGSLPRTAAAVLTVSMVPTAAYAHRFWEQPDPDARRREREAFLTDVSLLGAVALAALAPGGRAR